MTVKPYQQDNSNVCTVKDGLYLCMELTNDLKTIKNGNDNRDDIWIFTYYIWDNKNCFNVIGVTLMIIFCQSFTSENVSISPREARGEAVMFANKVNESGDIISISEATTKWGNTVTIWYKSMKKVEV